MFLYRSEGECLNVSACIHTCTYSVHNIIIQSISGEHLVIKTYSKLLNKSALQLVIDNDLRLT